MYVLVHQSWFQRGTTSSNCLSCQTSWRSSYHSCGLGEQTRSLVSHARLVTYAKLHHISPSVCWSIWLCACLPFCFPFFNLWLEQHCFVLFFVFFLLNKSEPVWSVVFKHWLYDLDAQHCTAADLPPPLVSPTTPPHLPHLYFRPKINSSVDSEKWLTNTTSAQTMAVNNLN